MGIAVEPFDVGCRRIKLLVNAAAQQPELTANDN